MKVAKGGASGFKASDGDVGLMRGERLVQGLAPTLILPEADILSRADSWVTTGFSPLDVEPLLVVRLKDVPLPVLEPLLHRGRLGLRTRLRHQEVRQTLDTHVGVPCQVKGAIAMGGAHLSRADLAEEH